MYFEASLHGLKFKASGVSGVGGRSPARLKKAGGWVGGGGGAQPPPICKQNARMMCFESTL